MSICHECAVEVGGPDRVDLDSIAAVRQDLADSVNHKSEYSGLHASSTAERARSASRVAWLASRLAWVESCELLAAESNAKMGELAEAAAG